MKSHQSFLITQGVILISVLLYTLLFKHLGNIYNVLYQNQSNILNNLTVEKVDSIVEGIDAKLKQRSINKFLYRYFIFLYTDEYTNRQVLTGESKKPLTQPVQNISNDLFYREMLSYHLNDICLLRNVIDIPASSSLYKNLESQNEIQKDVFYVSCPVYIDDELIGYIGGLSKRKNNYPSISIEINAVRNAASSIQRVFKNE